MSFLRDENLTFHRFATDDSRRPSEDIGSPPTQRRSNTIIIPQEDNERNFTPNVWTTTTSSSKSNYTTGTNEFHYIPGVAAVNGVHDISAKNLQLQNGSTAKLLPSDDQTNKQVINFNTIFVCILINFIHRSTIISTRSLLFFLSILSECHDKLHL